MFEKYDTATIRRAEALAEVALTANLKPENNRQIWNLTDKILHAIDGADTLKKACAAVDCFCELAEACDDKDKADKYATLIEWAWDAVYDCDWDDPCPDLPAPHEVARWQAEESRTDYDY